jgi:hypothetical protein
MTERPQLQLDAKTGAPGRDISEVHLRVRTWDDTARQRFHALRERERQGALTAVEAELRGLYGDLEEMEASALRPAIARKRHETEKLRAINEALRDVIQDLGEHFCYDRRRQDSNNLLDIADRDFR